MVTQKSCKSPQEFLQDFFCTGWICAFLKYCFFNTKTVKKTILPEEVVEKWRIEEIGRLTYF